MSPQKRRGWACSRSRDPPTLHHQHHLGVLGAMMHLSTSRETIESLWPHSPLSPLPPSVFTPSLEFPFWYKCESEWMNCLLIRYSCFCPCCFLFLFSLSRAPVFLFLFRVVLFCDQMFRLCEVSVLYVQPVCQSLVSARAVTLNQSGTLFWSLDRFKIDLSTLQSVCRVSQPLLLGKKKTTFKLVIKLKM